MRLRARQAAGGAKVTSAQQRGRVRREKEGKGSLVAGQARPVSSPVLPATSCAFKWWYTGSGRKGIFEFRGFYLCVIIKV